MYMHEHTPMHMHTPTPMHMHMHTHLEGRHEPTRLTVAMAPLRAACAAFASAGLPELRRPPEGGGQAIISCWRRP